MSGLPFELAADESIIVYGDMAYRKNAVNVDEGIGIITNKRFIYLVAKTNILKIVISKAVSGLLASLIKNKAKILFQIQASEIKQIQDKKIVFRQYIQIITQDKEYLMCPEAQKPAWDEAFQKLIGS